MTELESKGNGARRRYCDGHAVAVGDLAQGCAGLEVSQCTFGEHRFSFSWSACLLPSPTTSPRYALKPAPRLTFLKSKTYREMAGKKNSVPIPISHLILLIIFLPLIPTRLSTIGLEPCVDGLSAGWHCNDTASDADKSVQHFSASGRLQWKTTPLFLTTPGEEEYRKALHKGNTVTSTVRLLPTRPAQSQQMLRCSRSRAPSAHRQSEEMGLHLTLAKPEAVPKAAAKSKTATKGVVPKKAWPVAKRAGSTTSKSRTRAGSAAHA
ncbi:hypothetical protein LFL96_11435 [Paraburkholderia sp. D15]|uniref:hypothetical protein n=1 Tax=Paraburkholderia sp. D15 TaxID=2880218 RepID=UPI002479E24A|nr:hypothetical protein [Paraburkholderia sp. D15]WGS48408.1 hypothetical protein LFL96_11435 [Paraburkholderia sp. D15]